MTAAAGQQQQPPPPQQQQQQQQQRQQGATPYQPMAGRVLLLGRTTRRLGSPQEVAALARSRRRSSSSAGGGGGGAATGAAPASSSLASRGAAVEALSRLTSATIVAPLPTQPAAPARQGSNPLLWQTIFGSRPATTPASPSGTAGGGVVAAPDGLPRIRTRPLGEAREDEQQQQQQQQDQQQRQREQLARAGSLLLRKHPVAAGTPRSMAAGTARAAQRHGALHPTGSGGPFSPTALGRRASGATLSPQLRCLEADREAIAAGARLVQPSGATAGASGSQLLRWDTGAAADADAPVGVRLCVRWLDELVVALWVRCGGRACAHIARKVEEAVGYFWIDLAAAFLSPPRASRAKNGPRKAPTTPRRPPPLPPPHLAQNTTHCSTT